MTIKTTKRQSAIINKRRKEESCYLPPDANPLPYDRELEQAGQDRELQSLLDNL